MARTSISYLWRDKDASQPFHSGVSLHSHTSQSVETLDFLANLGNQYPFIKSLIDKLQRKSEARHGLQVDFAGSYWTPPATPKIAFDLESRQVQQIGLDSMVSITDHDNIKAPMLLRTVPSARQIPVSVEWAVPYGSQAFHLGIHNLPSSKATEWMAALAAYTASPSDAGLTEILQTLSADRNILIVFNHPLWDLYLVGADKHNFLVNEFLLKNGNFLHALELNGLRPWDENREVRILAEKWNMLLISGGDRHGMEPAANINLTHATCFSEFVHDVRRGESQVLFMPQYAQPWKHRLLLSVMDAIRYYPDFPEGSRRWDERVYHPDRNGIPRPLTELWPSREAPRAIRVGLALVRLIGSRPISDGIKMALTDSRELKLALNRMEA